MRWAIRGEIGAGFGLAVLILVTIGVVSYRSITQLIENGRLVAQTHQLLEALESTRAHMTEIETGARGYVITGDDRYLESYSAALTEVDQDIGDLRRLAAGHHDQQEYLKLLAALIPERVALIMETLDLRQHRGFEAARQMALADQGKTIMDTIRVVINAAKDEARALLRRQDAEATQSARSATLTITIGSLLALTLVAVATVIINRDITGLRRAEAALRKSEELYRTLVKNFPNGSVLLFDHDLRYTIADGLGLATIGLSKEALEGKTIWEALPPETCAIVEPHYRAALAGEARSFELPRANRVYLVHTLPIKNESGDILAGMVMSQDITQRKEVERLKDDFLSTVSHELRTPLSSLRGFAELLLEREFPPERR